MPDCGCSEAGVPGQIRTVDLALRRRALYPSELRGPSCAKHLVYMNLRRCSAASQSPHTCPQMVTLVSGRTLIPPVRHNREPLLDQQKRALQREV